MNVTLEILIEAASAAAFADMLKEHLSVSDAIQIGRLSVLYGQNPVRVVWVRRQRRIRKIERLNATKVA